MEVYIYEAKKTVRGRGDEKGSLHGVKPVELFVQTSNALLKHVDKDKINIDDVILGCSTASGEQGSNIAKIAALYANLPESANGVTISSFCTSGIEALNFASARIATNMSDVCIAGGLESMSRVGMFSDKGSWFSDRSVSAKTNFIHMGVAADVVAQLNGISRDQIDAYSVRSHELALEAWNSGLHQKNTIPIKDNEGVILLNKDELIRSNVTTEKMQHLTPLYNEENAKYFDKVVQENYPQLKQVNHIHHIGTAPGLADAAALLLLGNRSSGKKIDQKPIGQIVAFGSASVEPVQMLHGPSVASEKALKNANLTWDDLDIVEINESFAAIPLKFQKDSGIALSKINVNGGAIAMGHPLGATGGILVISALAELKKRGGRYALITICAGAGIASAIIIKNIQE